MDLVLLHLHLLTIVVKIIDISGAPPLNQYDSNADNWNKTDYSDRENLPCKRAIVRYDSGSLEDGFEGIYQRRQLNPVVFQLTDRAVKLALSRRIAKSEFSAMLHSSLKELGKSLPDASVFEAVNQAVKLSLTWRLSSESALRVARNSYSTKILQSSPDLSVFESINRGVRLALSRCLSTYDSRPTKKFPESTSTSVFQPLSVSSEKTLESSPKAIDAVDSSPREITSFEAVDAIVRRVMKQKLSKLYAVNVAEETKERRPSNRESIDLCIEKPFSDSIEDEAVKRAQTDCELTNLDPYRSTKNSSTNSFGISSTHPFRNEIFVEAIEKTVKRVLTQKLAEIGRSNRNKTTVKLYNDMFNMYVSVPPSYSKQFTAISGKTFYKKLKGKGSNVAESECQEEIDEKNDLSETERKNKRNNPIVCTQEDTHEGNRFAGEGTRVSANKNKNLGGNEQKNAFANGRNLLVIRLKNSSEVEIGNVLAEIERVALFDTAKFEIDRTILFPSSEAVLFVCKTEEGANLLREAANKSEALVESEIEESFTRQVWIPDIEEETSEDEIHDDIYMKYKEMPIRVKFSRVLWTENLKFAHIEVSESLFRKMEASPYIRIRRRDHEIDTSTEVKRCGRCWLLGHIEKFCTSVPRSYPSSDENCLDCGNFNRFILETNSPSKDQLRDVHHRTDDDNCPTKRSLNYVSQWQKERLPFINKSDSFNE